jgi:hypothetical protein
LNEEGKKEGAKYGLLLKFARQRSNPSESLPLDGVFLLSGVPHWELNEEGRKAGAKYGLPLNFATQRSNPSKSLLLA